MGALSIYLIPETEVEPEIYGRKARQVLLDMGVIEDENYEEPNWWVAGPSSAGIFEDGDDEDIGFEFCILYASKHVDIVPQEAAEFPLCPACDASVSDQFYDLVNGFEEKYEDEPAEKAEALKTAVVTCPACGAASAIASLKTDVGIFLSGTWINFEDPPGPLRADWLEKFDAATGWKNRCLEYYYT
jgi:hypothetical protein